MKMTFFRKSPFSGEINAMDIDLEAEDYLCWQMDGVPIQKAMPYLSADEREFLISGITPGEWEAAFG